MRKRRIEEHLELQAAKLVELDHKLDILQLYFDVRDPGSAKSAEAYDGLRKLLIQAYKQTQVHLAHLSQIHYALASGVEADAVKDKVEELMAEVGLVRIDKVDRTTEAAFRVVEGEGEMREVLTPAYVEAPGGALVKEGTARASQRPAEAVEVVEVGEPEVAV